MNKKVLIYFNESDLKPVGGPAGYLYNLKQELERFNNTNIEFIKDKPTKQYKIIKKLPKFILNIGRFIRHQKERKYLLGNSPKESKVDLNKYDIVHFHSTFSMYRCKDSLKNYKGKVLLTTHSPQPMFLEKYNDGGLLNIEKKLFKKVYLVDFMKIDEYAFNRADYIIFPCKEAEEPYYNTWDKYKTIKEKNSYKYKYLPTGILEVFSKEDSLKYRKKLNIDSNEFVISYVGRHNITKGYNVLKDVGKTLLNEDNITFLIGGKEEPLKGLKNKKWIEIGWTNDPFSLINSSNIFILPNKNTYFDLIMLEVLSLGKVVVASNTGGNKYIKNLDNSDGVFLYNNIEELKIIIKQLKQLPKEELKKLEIKNKLLFKQNFTVEKFYNNYINILENIK